MIDPTPQTRLAGKFTVKAGMDDITATCTVCHMKWKFTRTTDAVVTHLLHHYADQHSTEVNT